MMRVSILVPSRGRPDRLQGSLDSLRMSCRRPDEVELLVMLDEDNATQYSGFRAPFSGRLLITPRGKGYEELHLKYNQLASVATGDFLWLWNDDAVMQTQFWDDYFDKDVCKRHYGTVGANNWFPFISRQAHLALGHFSESAHCDTYLSEVFKGLPQASCPGIRIAHGPLHDQTFFEANQTWQRTKPLFDSPQVQDAIRRDHGTMAALIQSQGA